MIWHEVGRLVCAAEGSRVVSSVRLDGEARWKGVELHLIQTIDLACHWPAQTIARDPEQLGRLV